MVYYSWQASQLNEQACFNHFLPCCKLFKTVPEYMGVQIPASNGHLFSEGLTITISTWKQFLLRKLTYTIDIPHLVVWRIKSRENECVDWYLKEARRKGLKKGRKEGRERTKYIQERGNKRRWQQKYKMENWITNYPIKDTTLRPLSIGLVIISPLGTNTFWFCSLIYDASLCRHWNINKVTHHIFCRQGTA